MRGLAASFLARRMRSTRLLLGSVLLTVLITASLTAALASFGAAGLPQAVHRQLAHSPALSIAVSGAVNGATAAADTQAVRTSMRAAFGTVPYGFDAAVWSDPLGLPSPHGGRTVPLTEAAAIGGLRAHATLVAGRWPGPPPPGGPVGAALPATAAQRLGLAPGDLLRLRDRVSGRRFPVRITGLFGVREPTSGYWNIDLIATSGISVADTFVTYGPLVVSPAAFGAHGITVGAASWEVTPDGSAIDGPGITGLAARVAGAAAHLRGSARLGGLQVRTGLPGLLAGTGRNLVVARSLLTMGMLQLLLLAAAALGLAARLLASHREEEAALLSSRGAGRWQLLRPALAEAAVLGVVAAGGGALLGSYLAGLLMNTGALRGTGLRVPGTPPGAWLAAAAVLALSTAILLWPAIRPPAPGVARARRGRQAALAGIARAGADLSLVVLAVIAVWELRAYSAVAHSPAGGIGIDPVPVLAPALALAGLTLVPLRLLPAAARGIDGAVGRTTRLGAALASWEISRRPVRQSGPVLLVILAVGTGTLALAQYQSWRRSAADQAAFAVGADVRVDMLTPLPLAASGAVAHAPGVISAIPVASYATANGEIMGLDARGAAATVLLRPDLAPAPAATLWRRIAPPGPRAGLALPGRPARLRLTASLAGGGAGNLGSVPATLAIQDASGIVYDTPAGVLRADGHRHDLVAVLSPARRAAYPLRLLGVSLTYTLPPFAGAAGASRVARHPATLTIGDLAAAQSAAGPFGRPFASGAALAAWQPAVSSSELGSLPAAGTATRSLTNGSPPAIAHWQEGAGRTRRLGFRAGQGPSPIVLFDNSITETAVTGSLTVTAAAPARFVPAIATESYLRASRAGTGSIVPVTVGGASIPVKIVAAVAGFPTVGAGGALIVDQGQLQGVLASRWQPPLPVTQWWLRTARGAVPRGLPPGSAVTDRARGERERLQNPMSALPQQAALAIAAAATLLAAVGFSVSVAASLRARQTQSAVLAALGVARSGQAGQLCLEQLMLSVPAAAAGLLAGAALAHALVPAVTLTPQATTPVPPVLVVLPLAWSVGLALAVAAIPVLVAAVTVARRRDPAAQLRAAQAT